MLSEEQKSNLQAQAESERKKLESTGVKFYDLDTDPRGDGIVLATYGRSWIPSDNEEFFCPSPAKIVYTQYTVNKEVRYRANLYMWSSITGWDVYPLTPFSASPDVKEEQEQLYADPDDGGTCVNRRLVTRQDDRQCARLISKLGIFRTKEIVLHGPTWEEQPDGTRKRVPDSLTKENREPYTYFKVII